MAKPSGVRSFGFTSQNDKGEKQPSAVGGQKNAVEKKGGGSSQKYTVPLSRESENQPASVKRGDGTEDRGSNPKTRQMTPKAPGNSKQNTDARPSEVHVYKGTSVPKRAR